MRFFILALLLAVSVSPAALLAQARKEAPPCALFFGSPIDPQVAVATCTQLIENGKLTGRALARAYLTRMLARAMAGTPDDAQIIADATAVIENDPEVALAYWLRADSYHRTGDDDRALQDATKFIELDPANWDALKFRGSIYVAKGDYERALADATKVVEMVPRIASAYADRAWMYLKAGRTTEALSDLSQALSLPHPVCTHYFQRGKILEDMGRTQDAIADYRNALRLEPNHAGYRETLRRLGVAP
jgi:tetratricopeptide (TPR) repeat protein